jgi:hypothetical protein
VTTATLRLTEGTTLFLVTSQCDAYEYAPGVITISPVPIAETEEDEDGLWIRVRVRGDESTSCVHASTVDNPVDGDPHRGLFTSLGLAVLACAKERAPRAPWETCPARPNAARAQVNAQHRIVVAYRELEDGKPGWTVSVGYERDGGSFGCSNLSGRDLSALLDDTYQNVCVYGCGIAPDATAAEMREVIRALLAPVEVAGVTDTGTTADTGTDTDTTDPKEPTP